MTKATKVAATVATAAKLFGLVAWAQAQVATFDSYAEGTISAATGGFTEPSGFRFENSTRPPFVAEFVGSQYTSLPRTAGGNMLVSGGFGPGSGYGLPANFGFDGFLPRASDGFSLDVNYSTIQSTLPTSLQLQLFDQAGGQLSSQTFTFPTASFRQERIEVTRSSADIASFRIVPLGNMFTGYDNIALPEPASVVGLAAVAMLASMRRRVS